MKYIHFTDDQGADEIIATGTLMASSIVDGVFAVAVGGSASPEVQHTKLGRPENRNTAVVFSAKELPDVAFPKKIIWHLPRIQIYDAVKMPTEEAMKLLDGSLPTNGNDWLEIPLHPSVVDRRTLERTRLPENVSKGKILRRIHNLEEERRKKLFSR